jgi:uncharacterized protein (DUF302 family)
MAYYFNRSIAAPFGEVVQRATEALKKEGFGIITEIDVTETLRKKIGVEFRNYRILGACNPRYAHEALGVEDKIGTMLPCNVIVQETVPGTVEVAAIDPVASMAAVDNPKLKALAGQVGDQLRKVVAAI